MSGFSADWLALRAAADTRSRSQDLLALAADTAARGGGPVHIVDLGSGTGATVRALAPLIAAPQRWTLVDADAGLLAEAERSLRAAPPAADLTVETRVVDLANNPAPWEAPPRLVTASALFDLASRSFIARIVERLAADRVPLLALLTYDGRLSLSPGHPLDAEMAAAFDAHQRGEKSFGPAAGPDGAPLLADALETAGFTVHRRDSSWRLARTGDGDLMDAMLEGWATAAKEIAPARADAVDEWLGHARRAESLTVGHTDILAV